MIRALLVLYFFVALGCVQSDNSSSQDDSLYNQQGAKAIFAASCAGTCHAFQSMTDAQLVASGLVVVGDPDNSKIYNRLIGSTGGDAGKKNMPQGLPPLSSAELLTIRNWVTNLSP